MVHIAGKRILITGAGSGLGRAMAIEFAKEGCRIAVADINQDRAKKTVELVNKKGGEGFEIICDVKRATGFDRIAKILKKEWGGIDILVNNAAVAAAGYMEKIGVKDWDWIINENLKSVIYGCRTFIPVLAEQGEGYIVNIASSAGIVSLPEMSSYNVCKAGVISLSETLRVELAKKNIGVTVVTPTFFKSNLMDQFICTDEGQRKFFEACMEKASVTPERIAQHVVKSIKRKRMYVITQLDGKFAWRFKRYLPELYFKILSYVYCRDYLYKIFNIKAKQ